jgi:hypothetical protein
MVDLLLNTVTRTALREVLDLIKKDEPSSGFSVEDASTNETPRVVDVPRVSKSREPLAIKILETYKWFVSREEREIIDLVRADLILDFGGMRKEARSSFFIHAVLLWRVLFGVILPVLWFSLTGVFVRGFRAMYRLLRL